MKIKVTKTPATSSYPHAVFHIKVGDVSFYATHWVYSVNASFEPKMIFSVDEKQTGTLAGDAAIQFDSWENP